jgi:hypothetical protein
VSEDFNPFYLKEKKYSDKMGSLGIVLIEFGNWLPKQIISNE